MVICYGDMSRLILLSIFNKIIILTSLLSDKRKHTQSTVFIWWEVLLICLFWVLYFLVRGGWIFCRRFQQSVIPLVQVWEQREPNLCPSKKTY